MRLSSRSTGPSRRRRRYNSFGWREREKEGGMGTNQSTGRCRSFWRDEPPFQLFSLPSLDIPTYLPPNVPFCQEGRRGRSCLLERNQVVGSWINRATRVIIRFTDSAPPPRDEIQVFRYRVVSIVSIPLRFEISRGTVSFLFFSCLSTRQGFVSNRGKMRRICFSTIFIIFFLSLEEKGREVRNNIPYYSKFPRSNRRRCNIVHDDRRFYSDYFATRANEWNVDDGCVRSCEAS